MVSVMKHVALMLLKGVLYLELPKRCMELSKEIELKSFCSPSSLLSVQDIDGLINLP